MSFPIGKKLRIARSKAKVNSRNKLNRLKISVKKTNKHIYVRLLNNSGNVVTSFFSTSLSKEDRTRLSGLELATLVGEKFAENCKNNTKLKDKLNKKSIDSENKFIFDKGSYKYFGRIKNVAESCRKSGILI